ncbi:MAG: hypothetical protein WDZ29_03265 [Balneolaceae bacterium]
METEQERISLRTKLRGEIQKLIESMVVYPLAEQYQKEPEEIEPGLYVTMHSKWIDRIQLKFRGGGKTRYLLLKRYVDTNPPGGVKPE